MRHIKEIIRLEGGNEYYEGTEDIPKSRKPRGVANYELEHILNQVSRNKGGENLI